MSYIPKTQRGAVRCKGADKRVKPERVPTEQIKFSLPVFMVDAMAVLYPTESRSMAVKKYLAYTLGAKILEWKMKGEKK
jgi:hypothetical protein